MAQTIIVDTTPGYRMPTIYYSQGDIGRTFSIDLQSRFGESLPASPTITIQATKPSGLGFSVGSTSISGAVVTFTVTETMSNEAGRFPAELKIVKNSVTLFTANFYIDCEANAHPEGTTDGDIDHIMPKFMSVTTTTLPAGDSATYSFDANTNTATFGIPKGADGSLASQVLAADYSSSKTYAVGDYVYYSGNLYRCTTAITTAEAWTSGHWTQVALANDVSDVKSDIQHNLFPLLGYGNYWVNGSGNLAGDPTDTTGVRTNKICYATTDTLISTNWDEYQIYLYTCNADGTNADQVGTNHSDFVIEAGTYFVLVCMLLDNTQTISEDVFLDMVNSFYCRGVDNILTKAISEADSLSYGIDALTYHEYINSSTVAQWNIARPASSEADRRSPLIKVKQGDTFFYCLRGKSTQLIIALYNKNDVENGRTLDYIYGNTENEFKTTTGTYVVPQDGWLLFSTNITNFSDAYVFRKGNITDFIVKTDTKISDAVAENKDNETAINAINANFGSINMIARLGYNVYLMSTPPEQSLASFKLAYEKGYRILLCDVRKTADGKFVCWHDLDLKNNANSVRDINGDVLSTSVILSDLTLAELDAGYDFGIYKGTQYAGTKILRLTEFLELCKLLNAIPHIEIKNSSGYVFTSNEVKEICNLVKAYGLDKKVMYNTEASSQLQIIADNNPYAKIGYGTDLSSTVISTFASLNGEHIEKFAYCVTYANFTEENALLYAENDISLGYTEITSKADMDTMYSNGAYKYCKYIASRININDYFKEKLGV